MSTKELPLLFIFTIGLITLLASHSCKPIKDLGSSNNINLDTGQVKIELQDRFLFYSTDSSIIISNNFPSARLNGVKQLNDSTFSLRIDPENKPINSSPWYAFNAWAKNDRQVSFVLDYGDFKHRYDPKFSKNKKKWHEATSITRETELHKVKFEIDLNSDTTWISGQELIGVKDIENWLDSLKIIANFHKKTIGRSVAGRPIHALISSKRIIKPVVVFLGRQHPPEISGYLGYQRFVEEILNSSELAKKFRRNFDIVCIPMINPDGIYEGNWRHNLAGVDLNRDWDSFKQPETKAVRDFVENINSKIYFMVDFHSTYYDVFYTNSPVEGELLPGLAQEWIESFTKDLNGYNAAIKPSPNGGNVSKSWFSRQYGTQAITYEVGDNTPRHLIKEVAKNAAIRLMEKLTENKLK